MVIIGIFGGILAGYGILLNCIKYGETIGMSKNDVFWFSK
jgi:hypothetical protein